MAKLKFIQKHCWNSVHYYLQNRRRPGGIIIIPRIIVFSPCHPINIRYVHTVQSMQTEVNEEQLQGGHAGTSTHPTAPAGRIWERHHVRKHQGGNITSTRVLSHLGERDSSQGTRPWRSHSARGWRATPACPAGELWIGLVQGETSGCCWTDLDVC